MGRQQHGGHGQASRQHSPELCLAPMQLAPQFLATLHWPVHPFPKKRRLRGGPRVALWRVAPPSPGFVGRVHVYERSSVSTMVGLSSGLLAVASTDGDIPAGSDGHPGIDLWDCERVRQDPSRADEQVHPGGRESKCAIFHDDVRPFDSCANF